LFRTFANPLEASYEDAEPMKQLKFVELYYSDELSSKFKACGLLKFMSS